MTLTEIRNYNLLTKMEKGKISNMTKGFTLIEIMVAISIFLIVMTMSMGSVIGIFDVNRKSHSLKTVMSNLNLAVESMSREIRFGKNYHCCIDNTCSGVITDERSCPNPGSGGISFLSSSGAQIVYRFNGGVIEKSVDGGNRYIPITSPEVSIDNLVFRVAGTGDMLQPKVLITLKGQAGDPNKGGSNFSLQTLVSQRALDI